MERRNPIMVILLSIITLGIYSLVWFVTTKNQMNARGAQIPTAWLIIIPFFDIWWNWKFSEGVEIVTKKKIGTFKAFLLMQFLGVAGEAIIQSELNKIAA